MQKIISHKQPDQKYFAYILAIDKVKGGSGFRGGGGGKTLSSLKAYFQLFSMSSQSPPFFTHATKIGTENLKQIFP